MKKLLIIMCIALSLVFAFTSCGEETADTIETTDDGWSAIYRP